MMMKMGRDFIFFWVLMIMMVIVMSMTMFMFDSIMGMLMGVFIIINQYQRA